MQPTYLNQGNTLQENINLISKGTFITEGYRNILLAIDSQKFAERSNYGVAGIIMTIAFAILLPGFQEPSLLCALLSQSYIFIM